MRTKRNSGFTLVEILIVVVILGILAAIVIPQFSQASSDAKLSSLQSDLQTFRSQVALYKIQHDDLLPGQTVDDGAITVATFVLAMTTEIGGKGPYLQKMPSNPFITGDTADDITTALTGASPANGNSGWYISADTGQLYANDADHGTL